MKEIDSKLDGEEHINIYTKGKTRLGRLLTNLSELPVTHPVYGTFRCAEGLWYYLKTGCKHENLRALSGFEAKKYGRTLEVVWNKHMQEDFWIAAKSKVMNDQELFGLFVSSDLPFEHYYLYGTKVVRENSTGWLVEKYEELREQLQGATK